jgi:uncharacterized NAD(P)/FAD-binding protein YdhS
LPFFSDKDWEFFEIFYDFSWDFDLTAKSFLRLLQLGRKKKLPSFVLRQYLFHKLGIHQNGGEDAWMNIADDQKKRCVRHLKKYLSRLIHTAPSSVLEIVDAMQKEKRLQVLATRLVSVKTLSNTFELSLKKRLSNTVEVLQVDVIINCLGIVSEAKGADDRLVRQLLECGMIRADSDGLLLDTGSNFEIIDRFGQPCQTLYALGSLKKHPMSPTLTAPYVARQATDLAQHLLSLFSPKAKRKRILSKVVFRPPNASQ